MARYHIPIAVEGRYFAQIGELVTRWGWVENQSGVLIRELLRIKKPEGYMAIGNMGIQAKTRVIVALACHHFAGKQLATDFSKLASDIQKFDDFRNDVVHGLWVYFPKNSTEHALITRKRLQKEIDPTPEKDIIKHFSRKIAELVDIQNEAHRLTRAIKALRGKFA